MYYWWNEILILQFNKKMGLFDLSIILYYEQWRASNLGPGNGSVPCKLPMVLYFVNNSDVMNKGKTTFVKKVCQNTQTLNDLSHLFEIQIMAKSLVT